MTYARRDLRSDYGLLRFKPGCYTYTISDQRYLELPDKEKYKWKKIY